MEMKIVVCENLTKHNFLSAFCIKSVRFVVKSITAPANAIEMQFIVLNTLKHIY